MNYVTLVLCICSMICSIFAVLIMGEILPPIDPVNLSVGLLIIMALFFVYVAANNSTGETNGKDQNQSR